MKTVNILSTLALAIVLSACSAAPSDADIQNVATQSVKQMDQTFAPLGLKMSDIFETTVKIKNKAKQDDGRWLIEAETKMTALKDINELPENAQAAVMVMAGMMKKGQIIGNGPVTSKFYMQKGDNGWIATQ